LLILLRAFKWVSLTLLLVTLVSIYFMPRAILYPEYSIISWIQPFLILLILPLLVFTTLLSFTKRVKLSTVNAALSVGIVGPTFEVLKDYREKVELTKNGVWVNSIVVDRKKTGNRGLYWTIKCKYELNGRAYETLYHDDLSNLHPIGDTIRLIYSSEYPKIYALGSEWNK